MRELKFRAWDKSEFRMFNIRMMEIVKDDPNAIFMAGVDENVDGYRSKDINIMQGTGLTDKNGIDIYEGDIITSYPQDAIVFWNNNSASFMLKWINHDMKEKIVGIARNGNTAEEYEVIGNVYENTDMLHNAKHLKSFLKKEGFNVKPTMFALEKEGEQ